VIAEALLGRHLSRRGNDGRIHADPGLHGRN
jgi:hypothetical protein